RLPRVSADCQTNHHMFYMLLPTLENRAALIDHLRQQGIMSVFHYVPLHTAPVGLSFGYQHGDLPVTEQLSERLVRLPFYYDLSEQDQLDVVNHIQKFVWQSLGGRKAA